MDFTFIESDEFTKLLGKVLEDDEYSKLQLFLTMRPESGVLIPGGSGLRKLRWKKGSKGKSGGLRLIYYLHLSAHVILMIFIYPKSKQTDLTARQLKLLADDIRRKGGIV